MYPTARKDELIVQTIDGETMVYDLEADRAVCLNETSSIVWQNCDGRTSPKDIAAIVQKELGTEVNEDLVWFAVNALNNEKLLNPEMNYDDKFKGLSRRDVIKKVGLGTMVALPLVASLAAPSAVFAQSCIPPAPSMCGASLPANSNCSCSCECASGCCMANNMNCTGSTTSGCGP
jgi:hypothetical protein